MTGPGLAVTLRRAVLGVGLVIGLLSTPAVAQSGRTFDGWELRSGLLAHDVGIVTNAEDNAESDFDIHGQLLFPSPGFLSFLGAPRPHLGVNIAVDGTSQAFAGFTWDAHLAKETRILRNIFLTFDAGGSVHNGEYLNAPQDPSNPDFGQPGRFLGCRALFRFGAGIGYDINERVSAQVYADHISNFDMCEPDDGLNNIGVRLGYKF